MNFVGINVNPMAGGRQFVAPAPIERISFVKEIQVRSLSVNIKKLRSKKQNLKRTCWVKFQRMHLVVWF